MKYIGIFGTFKYIVDEKQVKNVIERSIEKVKSYMKP